jgi:hypothetical protein
MCEVHNVTFDILHRNFDGLCPLCQATQVTSSMTTTRVHESRQARSTSFANATFFGSVQVVQGDSVVNNMNFDSDICCVCQCDGAAHKCSACKRPVHNEVRGCSGRPFAGDEESGPLKCNRCRATSAPKTRDEDHDEDDKIDRSAQRHRHADDDDNDDGVRNEEQFGRSASSNNTSTTDQALSTLTALAARVQPAMTADEFAQVTSYAVVKLYAEQN